MHQGAGPIVALYNGVALVDPTNAERPRSGWMSGQPGGRRTWQS